MHSEIVKKIKKIRVEKGISTLQMAEKLHIDPTAYTRLESGKTNSWSKYFEDILNIFDISPEIFFEGVGKNINITNKKGSFGGNANIENLYLDNKEKTEKIEKLYEERLKDKDQMIEQLKSIISDLSNKS